VLNCPSVVPAADGGAPPGVPRLSALPGPSPSGRPRGRSTVSCFRHLQRRIGSIALHVPPVWRRGYIAGMSSPPCRRWLPRAGNWSWSGPAHRSIVRVPRSPISIRPRIVDCRTLLMARVMPGPKLERAGICPACPPTYVAAHQVQRRSRCRPSPVPGAACRSPSVFV